MCFRYKEARTRLMCDVWVKYNLWHLGRRMDSICFKTRAYTLHGQWALLVYSRSYDWFRECLIRNWYCDESLAYEMRTIKIDVKFQSKIIVMTFHLNYMATHAQILNSLVIVVLFISGVFEYFFRFHVVFFIPMQMRVFLARRTSQATSRDLDQVWPKEPGKIEEEKMNSRYWPFFICDAIILMPILDQPTFHWCFCKCFSSTD